MSESTFFLGCWSFLISSSSHPIMITQWISIFPRMCRSSPLLARSASTLTCNVTSLDSASTNFDLETTPVKLWSNNVEDQRALKTFTEETRRFRVPVIGRSQEELALVTTNNNDVHVLTQNPFGVHTFTSVARNQGNDKLIILYMSNILFDL